MFITPYNDDYLTFNTVREHYVLTAKAVFDNLGIDLNATAKDNVNGVKAFLNRVSELTYRKMHEFGDDIYQDKVIACTKTGRKIILSAMLEQCFYMKNVGDLSLSTDLRERTLYASDTLVSIFDEEIPEIGKSVINIGVCKWTF